MQITWQCWKISQRKKANKIVSLLDSRGKTVPDIMLNGVRIINCTSEEVNYYDYHDNSYICTFPVSGVNIELEEHKSFQSLNGIHIFERFYKAKPLKQEEKVYYIVSKEILEKANRRDFLSVDHNVGAVKDKNSKIVGTHSFVTAKLKTFGELIDENPNEKYELIDWNGNPIYQEWIDNGYARRYSICFCRKREDGVYLIAVYEVL